jgi:hypothetical protein
MGGVRWLDGIRTPSQLGNLIGTNREPELAFAASFPARAAAANRSMKISANMTESPRAPLEHERVICKVLGGQLLSARHHCDWINLNRRRGNVGLRI